MFSADTAATVKATVPLLRAHGLDVTRRLYEILFQEPAVKAFFNQSHQGPDGGQPKALAAAVLAYAENIDNPGVLLPAVERIAHRHVSMNVQPEHYAIVGRAILQAIKDVAGNAATPAVLAAWGEAYQWLADVLSGRENALYRETASKTGGWLGWRRFVVERVEAESAEIASVYLRPRDGGPVADYLPGQYVGLRAEVPGHGQAVRNYSLSRAPRGGAYRISVKRHGLVSGWLHAQAPGAEVELLAPAGEFHLRPDQQRPVVLLSSGVGLTPLYAMLESIAEQRPGLKAWYVHGARDGRHHALRAAVRAIEERCPNVTAVTFYSRPHADDVPGRDYDVAGRIDPAWLARTLPLDACDIFVCGPSGFMADMVNGLTAHGIAPDRIRHEFFGPTADLAAPAAAAMAAE
ncbi:MAG TPA: NO-inducible flavohemoprotein [Azospirillaceae bacterium]|nr:NO-inducible flavohemoprotein [Azospirillaceae bacterium]